jgi:hypothetical protein
MIISKLVDPVYMGDRTLCEVVYGQKIQIYGVIKIKTNYSNVGMLFL